jgi:CHAT domain-containing protein
MRRDDLTMQPTLLRARYGVILLLCALLGCGERQHGAPSAANVLERLEHRPFQGRPFDQMPFRPYGSQLTIAPTVAQGEGQTRRGDESDESSPRLARRASLNLALGRVDAAIRQFEELLAGAPTEARYHNDLAVAYLERGTREGHPFDLLAALRHSRRASLLAPDSPAAWFNLALALATFSLREQETAAWQRSLYLDDSSEWAEEARHQLRRTTQPTLPDHWGKWRERLLKGRGLLSEEFAALVATYPNQLRELVLEELLPGITDGRSTADAAGMVTELAREMVVQRGDRMLADSLDVLLARGPSDPHLLQAHRDFSQGLARYHRQEWLAARQLLDEAAAVLRRARSPLADEASLYAAICLYHLDVAASRQPLEQILAGLDSERYPSLAGRLHWMLGTVAMGLGQHEQAISHLVAMREPLRRGGGEDQAAMAETLLAENYDLRGEVERGWTHRLQGLGLQLARGTPRRRYSVLLEAAQALTRRGQADLALVFLQEARFSAMRWGEPLAIVEILSYRVRALAALGDSEGARQAADQALEIIAETPGGEIQQRLRGQALVSRGLAHLAVAPAQALADLRLGERLEAATRWRNDRTLIGVATARAQLALDDEAAARKSLRRVVQEYEEMRAEAIETSSRIAIFSHAMEAADLLIELAMHDDSPPWEVALSWSERSRGRSISDAWARRGPVLDPRKGSFVTDLLARVPPDRVVVEFAVLPRQTVVWVMERNRLRSVLLPISREQLTRDVEQFLSALKGDSASTRELGELLYEQLIRPLRLPLSEEGRVILVLDGVLERLPFAALFDRERKRFLIEETVLTVLPTARLLPLLTSVRRQHAMGHGGRPLIVGAPDLAGTGNASLPELPGADAEARSIASLYPTGILLRGSAATREAFLGALPTAGVVHFAGHVLALEESLDAGLLPLATGAGARHEVTAAEIRALRLDGTDLVVLAACRSLAGYQAGREGDLSVAGAFLAAGVPSVVAALWDVDDRTSPRVMLHFHRLVASGTDPPAALRQAMIESLRSSEDHLRSPGSWAAFAILGS